MQRSGAARRPGRMAEEQPGAHGSCDPCVWVKKRSNSRKARGCRDPTPSRAPGRSAGVRHTAQVLVGLADLAQGDGDERRPAAELRVVEAEPARRDIERPVGVAPGAGEVHRATLRLGLDAAPLVAAASNACDNWASGKLAKQPRTAARPSVWALIVASSEKPVNRHCRRLSTASSERSISELRSPRRPARTSLPSRTSAGAAIGRRLLIRLRAGRGQAPARARRGRVRFSRRLCSDRPKSGRHLGRAPSGGALRAVSAGGGVRAGRRADGPKPDGVCRVTRGDRAAARG